jgi:VWFA-related protein
MRPMKMAATLLTVALMGIPVSAVISARTAHAQGQTQDQPSVPQAVGTIQSETRLVNVYATVRDKRNAILDNLTKDDFKVLEDGNEQKITYFAREADQPITLAILMDTSYSMKSILGAEKEAASEFVHQIMKKRDEAIVMSFDTDIDLLADFTEDPSELTRGINRAEINVDASGIGGTPGTIPSRNGGTDLYDAIYLACHQELGGEAGRKAVILLTDAEDTGSKLSIDEAIESAQRANAVIHVLLISDPMATEGYGTGVALQMARDTGGRVIAVHNDKTLAKAFDEISEELRSQYILGYSPTNITRDGTYRKVRVEVTSQPDTKILSTKGYYAPNG